MEQWKEVRGYEKYECSNTGKIRRKLNGKELACTPNDRGYRTAYLWIDNENFDIKKVGKTIWETFNNCTCRKTIDHIDRNKLNDNLSNLRCITKKENSLNRDNYTSDNKYNLDENKKREIINGLKNKTLTTWKVWKKYGLPSNYTCAVVKKGSWNYLLNEKNTI